MLAGILSKIQQIRAGLTDARMAFLDKLNITGKVADGNDYTATRAGRLDKLDITGKVADGNDYTGARAAKLDNLDAAISAISPIKSIQRGEQTILGAVTDVTISSVNLSKSKLSFSWTTSAGTTLRLRARLTSSTNIRFTPGSGETFIADWEVVEYK